MKEKTRKRIEKKLNNLPRYFLDSSIFVEVIFSQHRSKKCMKYFNLAGYKYRLETSSVVAGEVIKSIMRESNPVKRENSFLLFNSLLSRHKVEILTPTFDCFSRIAAVRAVETMIGSMDCLVFSNFLDEGLCDFVTGDRRFSPVLEKEFSIRLHKV